jgi:hypothetical protein
MQQPKCMGTLTDPWMMTDQVGLMEYLEISSVGFYSSIQFCTVVCNIQTEHPVDDQGPGGADGIFLVNIILMVFTILYSFIQ